MNEINQLKKLMESVQLNEYLVRRGEPATAMLQLNIFSDAEDQPSEYEEEFRNSPEWMAIEKKYYQIAAKLENVLVQSDIKLNDEAVDAIHDVWYDGSDAYDDPEEAVHSLPQIYDAQLDIIRGVLDGEFDVNEAYGKEGTPYQNYKPEEGNDQYDKKTGEWSRSGQYDAQDNEDDLEERQSIAIAPDHFDLAFGSEGISILGAGGEPVLEMPLDDFIALVSKFNRQMGSR